MLQKLTRHLPSLLSLAITVIGFVFLGWTPGEFLAIIIVELAFIWVTTVVKLLFYRINDNSGIAINLFMSIFFTIHFGIFIFAVWIFSLNTLFNTEEFAHVLRTKELLMAIAIPFVFSTYNYFIGGRTSRYTQAGLMFIPYSRLFVLSFAFGAFHYMTSEWKYTGLTAQYAIVAAMVLLKFFSDYFQLNDAPDKRIAQIEA